jgi:DNA polymerase-3 subunit delta'
VPFPFEEIVQRLETCQREQRLGQAYLLTGSTPDAVERLAKAVAAVVLQESPVDHPDYFQVQPESKSRRITVEQIRDLEKSLYLRPYRAKRKVGVILAAERMCLPPAQAANAFLKTLEEPSASTLLLLTTTEPFLVLPTIISRCIRLDLWEQAPEKVSPEWEAWLKKWTAVNGAPELKGYARANLLHQFWQEERSRIEEKFEDYAGEEDTAKALVEGEFQLARLKSLAELQKFYWRRTENGHKAEESQGAVQAIQALEQLKACLETNVDAGLAVDCACLKIG